MGTDYTLTLPKGKIQLIDGKFRGQLFKSSQVDAWSPQNPAAAGGWVSGDSLTVIATFNTGQVIDPSTGQPYAKQPTPSDYYGLSVDALYNPTSGQVTTAENNLKRQAAGVAGPGITTSGTPNNATDIFYNAVSTKGTISLVPSSRGSFDVVYKWVMTFNPNFNNGGTTAIDTTKIELIFGYGDPMLSESMT